MPLTCGVTSGGTGVTDLDRVTPRPRTTRRRDDGLMALELAIATPFIIVMLLVVLAFGRVMHGRQLVDDAAFAAGRAAALAPGPGEAGTAARTAAAGTLADAGLSCRSSNVRVDATAFRPGGEVAVTVECVTGLTGTSAPGLPGQRTLRSTAHVPIELYRDVSP